MPRRSPGRTLHSPCRTLRIGSHSQHPPGCPRPQWQTPSTARGRRRRRGASAHRSAPPGHDPSPGPAGQTGTGRRSRRPSRPGQTCGSEPQSRSYVQAASAAQQLEGALGGQYRRHSAARPARRTTTAARSPSWPPPGCQPPGCRGPAEEGSKQEGDGDGRQQRVGACPAQAVRASQKQGGSTAGCIPFRHTR